MIIVTSKSNSNRIVNIFNRLSRVNYQVVHGGGLTVQYIIYTCQRQPTPFSYQTDPWSLREHFASSRPPLANLLTEWLCAIV